MATCSIQAANLFNVKGLVAVITGGGTGIGLMMAKALALNGAHKVYILGRRKRVLEAAAASVSTSNIIPMVCDVTSKESLKFVAAAIESETGYINVLVANAGIIGPRPDLPMTGQVDSIVNFQEVLDDVNFEDVMQTFKANTVATWYTVLAFLNLLDEGNRAGNVEQKSQVIATSSIAGFVRSSGPGLSYGQSKAATIHMMKQLATALTPHGIRSNVFCPGLFPSEMTRSLIEDGQPTKFSIPLGRIGNEEDIAGYILYLTSRAGGYISGNVSVVDGGYLSTVVSSF